MQRTAHIFTAHNRKPGQSVTASQDAVTRRPGSIHPRPTDPGRRCALPLLAISRTRARAASGFTLVESMATIAILAVLGSLASFILIPAVTGHNRSMAESQLHTELSLALDRIERELRNIQHEVDADAIVPRIDSMTASSIGWHGDTSIARIGSEVRLVKAGGGERVLLTDVTQFAVQAFDESNVAMDATLSGDACDAVRRIQITLTMQRQNVTQSLRTRVFLRSMMQTEGK